MTEMLDKSVYTHARNVTCPYCGHVDKDSWELDFGISSDEEILAECGERCTQEKSRYYTLPQPDLTNLRECFKDLITICTTLPLDEIKYAKKVDELIRTTKEVLEYKD